MSMLSDDQKLEIDEAFHKAYVMIYHRSDSTLDFMFEHLSYESKQQFVEFASEHATEEDHAQYQKYIKERETALGPVDENEVLSKEEVDLIIERAQAHKKRSSRH